MSTDAPRGTKRYEPLDTDGDSPGNDGKRRLEAVRRVGELGTSACSQLRIDEDELWSQLFHHNE